MTMQIPNDRLAKLETLTLLHGSHSSFEDGACAMEVVSYLAREEHTDHPHCTCPAIAGFMRSWNDSFSDDAERTRVLRPLLTTVIGTRGSDQLLVRRSYMAIDWDIRVRSPAWLRAAGLVAQAEAIEALPEITTRQGLERARQASAAAWDAASAAASAAAMDAAMDAAWAALRPTVEALQASAQDLVRRMCALTEADVEGWSWDKTASADTSGLAGEEKR